MASRTKEILRSLVGIAPRSASRDSALREEFLVVVHAIAAVAIVLWTPIFWTRDRDTGVFLTIEFLAGYVVSAVLRVKGHVSSAAVVMLVLSSHAAAFAMKANGVASPAGGLFLVSIILCGLLLGRWFLLTWTIICLGVVVWVAVEESRGGAPFPRTEIKFWIGLIVVTALLMGSLARRLERAFALARGHGSAMARILNLATSGARTEEAQPAALSAIASELGADHASLVRAGEQPGADNSSALRVPLARGRRVLGEIVLERRSGGTFSPNEVELAKSLAQPVAVVLLLGDLAAVEREAAVLEERNRIGRDIHDSLAQGFTGVILQCQAAAAALPADVGAARAHLDRARDLARASLEEARRSVWALRPPALGREGLAAAVERLAREITTGTGIAVRAEMEGAIVTLPEAVDEELRGVAREAIVNAVRHAAPREIRTSVRYGAASVTLEIGDDGSGARAAAAAEEPGFGATSLRERVSKIGGKLSVDSRPGEGTRVRVDVPLPA